MKRWLALAALVVVSAGPVAWAAGALYFDLPLGAALRTVLTVAWLLAALAALALVRPLRRAALVLALGFAAILAWWLTIRPRQDRQWLPEVAVLPRATIAGERVTLHDVRDFDYRTEQDFTPRYEERTYDLANLRGLDVFQCYWGSEWIAHPIFSFDFGPDGHVCFSIETRKEVGEGYSTLGGLYRGFELIYVVAEERDVVRLRTNFRQGEDVYLYRLAARSRRCATSSSPTSPRERARRAPGVLQRDHPQLHHERPPAARARTAHPLRLPPAPERQGGRAPVRARRARPERAVRRAQAPGLRQRARARARGRDDFSTSIRAPLEASR
jgi:hypothetical protein